MAMELSFIRVDDFGAVTSPMTCSRKANIRGTWWSV